VTVAEAEPITRPCHVFREDAEGVAVLVVTGEVDRSAAPALHDELLQVIAERALVIDLCGARFVDASGPALLLDAARARHGGLPVVCAPDGPVPQLVHASELRGSLRIHDSRAQAIADAR
jgi:anti-anti-sigma factor